MTEYDEIRRRATPQVWSNRSYAKVFCIGFNKTGTTSLEFVLKTLGFRLPNLLEQLLRLVKQTGQGNFGPLVDFVSQYDAFQDNPFSQGILYAQVDALFPRSKFILTTRDPEDWYQSYCRYACQFFQVDSVMDVTKCFLQSERFAPIDYVNYRILRKHALDLQGDLVVENWPMLYDKSRMIDIYCRRNEQIVKYFVDRPTDLLVLDVKKEKDVSRILDFLVLPSALNFAFPHLNRSK